jgi:hypothetical protein
MNRIICILIVLFVSGCAGLQRPEEAKMAVSALLDEIQFAVDEINDKTKNNSLPPFKNAEITLSTEASEHSEAQASFFVSAKGGYKNSKSNTIVLVLEPSSKKGPITKKISGQKIAEYVIAVVSAIDEKKSLELKTLTVTAGLSVVKTEGAGVSIELVGVSVEGGATASSTTGNQLKLVFENSSRDK